MYDIGLLGTPEGDPGHATQALGATAGVEGASLRMDLVIPQGFLSDLALIPGIGGLGF
jgi:hypothetical protein